MWRQTFSVNRYRVPCSVMHEHESSRCWLFAPEPASLAAQKSCGLADARFTSSNTCNDPADPAQVRPLMHTPQRMSSCEAPDGGADDRSPWACRAGSKYGSYRSLIATARHCSSPSVYLVPCSVRHEQVPSSTPDASRELVKRRNDRAPDSTILSRACRPIRWRCVLPLESPIAAFLS
jgi:hypothetical protein